ncbi:alpha/beta hydrolase [Calothrix sp. NIES-2098]|uniref:alpha/beta hydrolase n=1 Tax=Calothrix sp. NIES-2098 TaxID=1954171 RepID=UPI000BBB843A
MLKFKLLLAKSLYGSLKILNFKSIFQVAFYNLILATLINLPALGAERITFSFAPFGEFYLSADALELFAKEGKIDSDFAFYAKFATPQQLAVLRSFLQQHFPISPVMVSQFTYSPLGEEIIRQLGKLVETEGNQNGFYALRSALILAATDPQGMTVLDVLHRFPSDSLKLNLNQGITIAKNFSKRLKQQQAAVSEIKKQAAATSAVTIDFSQKPDLRQVGPLTWQKITLSLYDASRSRQFASDIYLPHTTTNKLIPLVVISHGAFSDRTTFAYLAQHLASYGFATAVLEHPGISRQRFQQYFAGLATPPETRESINQPLDVKYLLDELERRQKSDPRLSRLALHQVGVIGQSAGGYTALALAGATINFEQLNKACQNNRELWNFPLLVQCKTTELLPGSYSLQDKRIKAAIAVNPLTSSLLGQSGLSQIQEPVMMVASGNDFIAPADTEQIRPFTWLSTPDKYLVMMEQGTHLSTLGDIGNYNFGAISSTLMGPSSENARKYLSALSVAFMETYIANNDEYRPYLSTAYAKFLSQPPLNLDILQSLAIAK